MKIEKLRNNHKKEIIIGTILTVVIGGALTYKLTHSKYRTTQSIDLATGVINYTVPDFKIMAMYKSDDNTNYTEINEMPESGYTINEEKTYCTTDNKTQVKGKIKTENGKHYITGLSKSDKCYLYFDKEVQPIPVDDIIAANTPKTTIPTFSTIATTDEGVYSVSDGMYGGTSYYWRGAVTNNYVKFAGFCWRIIRINGDKTIRLIYDGTTCHANGMSTLESIAKTKVSYNSYATQSNYVGWTYSGTSQRSTGGTSSNAKTQLENWYANNITGTNASKIANGKYCNDRNTASGNTWRIDGSLFYYAAHERIREDYAPTLSCPSGDVYMLNVGLITADEVEFAGGNTNSNKSYYLYNGYDYWTMSPSYWHSSGIAIILYVGGNGDIYFSDVSGNSPGLRPVINLKADTTFASGGTGTQNNPYIVQ